MVAKWEFLKLPLEFKLLLLFPQQKQQRQRNASPPTNPLLVADFDCSVSLVAVVLLILDPSLKLGKPLVASRRELPPCKVYVFKLCVCLYVCISFEIWLLPVGVWTDWLIFIAGGLGNFLVTNIITDSVCMFMLLFVFLWKPVNITNPLDPTLGTAHLHHSSSTFSSAILILACSC